MKKLLLLLFIVTLATTGCIKEKNIIKDKDSENKNIITEQKQNTDTKNELKNDTKNSLANPASVNCEKQGGKITIAKKPDGSEYGLCYFDDNRACEEWAMFRGECPVGGVKTTGYDNDAQKYCVFIGGKTIAEKNAICNFNDGSKCSVDDLYNDKCQKDSTKNDSKKATKNYKIEKILDKNCSKDSDCETPAEYLVRSNCPFTSKCLQQKCTVICPEL